MLRDSSNDADLERLRDCDKLTERDSTRLAERERLKLWLRLCDLETLCDCERFSDSLLQDCDIDRLTERDLLWDCECLALNDSAPLALMLRLCDCDSLLNLDVLCSFERDIERDIERLIDGLRDPLFEIEIDFEMLRDFHIESEPSTLPLLLCETDWLME